MFLKFNNERQTHFALNEIPNIRALSIKNEPKYDDIYISIYMTDSDCVCVNYEYKEGYEDRMQSDFNTLVEAYNSCNPPKNKGLFEGRMI